MNNRQISTRTAFVLVSIVTLTLLIGSSILSRIVFKATSVDATLYFSQSIINARSSSTFTVDVLADLSAETSPAGVQLEIDFDPNIIQPVSSEPPILWKQVYSKTENGRYMLVLVPVEPRPLTERVVQKSILAHLTFLTLAEGTTSLRINTGMTILAVSDTSEGQGVVNIISSVIDAQVHITKEGTGVTNSSSTKVDSATTQPPMEFNSQRIISTSPILTPNAALILIRLEQPSRVSVAFGQSLPLENRAEYSTKSNQAAIRIVGLESNKRYYYQVMAEDDTASNRILGQVKSFELPFPSSTNIVDRSELTIFPPRAAQNATAYAVFFDQENNIIGGLEPQLQPDNPQFSATNFSEVAGLYQASIKSTTNKRQSVRFNLMLNDRQSSSYSAIFDPSLDPNPTSSAQARLAIKLDQKAINLILTLVASLIMLGVGFYKLARAK